MALFAALRELRGHSQQEQDEDERQQHGNDQAQTQTTTVSSSASRRRRSLRYCLGRAIHNVKSHWKILVFGQALSFLLACTGAAQATFAYSCHLSAPTFSVGLFYVALSFCLVPVYLQQRRGPEAQDGKHQQPAYSLLGLVNRSAAADQNSQENEVLTPEEATTTEVPSNPHYSFFCGLIQLHAPAWVYFLMAVIDVYANYFTVLAFKYTTITSVTLFDALAIPTSLILSKFLLNRQFSALHFVGVFACSVGIVLNVMQDYEEDREKNDHTVRGDFFAILGGVMFGANNVAGEVAVRNLGGVNEYLGMLGLFASFICIVQAAILERKEIAEFFGSDDSKEEACKDSSLWWLLAVFVFASVLSYLGGSRFLQLSEATFFNLSLLTGDLWSVAFSVFSEQIVPKPLFFVALVFILSGVVVYEMAPTPVLEDREEEQTRVVETELELQGRSSSDSQIEENPSRLC